MKRPKFFFTVFMMGWFLFTIFPIYWTISTSLKDPSDVAVNPPKLLFVPSLKNYKTVLVGGTGGFYSIEQEGFWRSAVNSLLIASITSLIAVSLAALTSFYLVQRKASARRFLMWALSFRMMPPMTIAIPYYIMLARIGLVDSIYSLILVNTVFNAPVALCLICPYMMSISDRYDEMANVDGFHTWAIFWKIFLPMSKPGLAAASIMVFVFTWNEFLFALILTGFKAKTLTVLATGFITQRGIIWGQLTATAVLITAPVLLLAVVLRKHFSAGLTLGLRKVMRVSSRSI